MGLNLNDANIIGAKTVTADGKAKKPTAKIWLNPGKMITFAGEEEPTFVGLAQGLPVDTMDPAKTNYSNPKMRDLGQAKNSIHAAIMKAAEGKHGGDVFYVNLLCQVRIVNDDAAPAEQPEIDAVTLALADLLMV